MNGKAQSISIADAAGFLKTNDNYYILTHLSPDGDAMGSGFGLCFALRGKFFAAVILKTHHIPREYALKERRFLRRFQRVNMNL